MAFALTFIEKCNWTF